jgi:hypothetical protein
MSAAFRALARTMLRNQSPLMCPSVATARGGPAATGAREGDHTHPAHRGGGSVIPRSRYRLLSNPLSTSQERFDEAAPQLPGGGEDLLVGLDLLVHGLVELHDLGLLGRWG